jgi:hypothetical protein
VKTIVACCDPELERALSGDLLRGRGLRLVSARSLEPLVSQLKAGADLCFLGDADTGGDARAWLREIRTDPSLASLPVVRVRAHAPALAGPDNAGFADVITLPAAPTAVALTVGRLLGIPLRAHQRFAVRVQVFGTEDDALRALRAASYLGTSVDLSERGMLLKVRQPIPVGTSLGLRFSLPGRSDELRVQAQVLRIEDRGFATQRALALAFEAVDGTMAEALGAYLRTLID